MAGEARISSGEGTASAGSGAGGTGQWLAKE